MTTEYGYILAEDRGFIKGSIEFDDTIQRVEFDESLDTNIGPFIIPGLIDIHTHGVMGYDFSLADPDEMREMSLFYAKNGVTSFLATTITATDDVLFESMKNFTLYERPEDGARGLGINMEGPFLSLEKKGAHRGDLLQYPDISLFERANGLSNNNIKLVSIAPELPGAMEFISEVSKVCRISLAHSEADYITGMQAFENGADHVTHLFNAINPFLSREPGIAGAAMDARAYVEIICDGIHLHPAVIRAIYKMFPGRVCMISDSISSTGMPDGNYDLGGLPIIVRGGKSVLAEDGSIAGSVITLMDGVRNAVMFGVPMADVFTAATGNNARSIGAEKELGSLTPGKLADIVVLDEQLNIQKVYINGLEI